MNLKKNLKSYSFWVNVSAAIVLLFQIVCEVFNLNISSEIMTSVLSGVCGILVVSGFVTTKENKSIDDISDDIKEKIEDLNKDNTSTNDSDDNDN